MGELLYRAELRSVTPGAEGCTRRLSTILKARERRCRASCHEPSPADSGRRQGSSKIRRKLPFLPTGWFSTKCWGVAEDCVVKERSSAFPPQGWFIHNGGPGGIGERPSVRRPSVNGVVVCSLACTVSCRGRCAASTFPTGSWLASSEGLTDGGRCHLSSDPRRRGNLWKLSTFPDPPFLLSVPDGMIGA